MMANTDEYPWAQTYALLAQVLLEAPRRNDPSLYNGELWATLPAPSEEAEEDIASVVAACPSGESDLTALGADYTNLFIGPPRPAAMPWQTVHANPNATSLSGTPTAQVRKTLRELGFQRDKDNGQLEDHIGNILMAAALISEHGNDEERRAFVNNHVLSWIDSLIADVEKNASTEFYSAVLALVKTVAEADTQTHNAA